jgi:TolB protein
VAVVGLKKPFWLLILPILISACVPEGVQVPQSPLLSSLERKSGLIAYIGLDGNIYTIDQSGGKLNAITDDALPQSEESAASRFYNFPTWSQNNRTLAFLGVSIDESGEATAEIFSSVEGEGSEILFQSDDDFPFYLYWSPDGENLGFLSTGPTGGNMALQIASAQGNESRIVDTGQPFYWAWSPSETEVIVHVGGSASANPGMAKLAFLSMEPRVVETGLNLLPSEFQAPAFSPDGEHILLATENAGGNSSLTLVNSNGAVSSIVANIDGPVAFDWSPEGDYIAYIENTRPTGSFLGALTFVDLSDSEEPITIETEAENVIAFYWSPDGDQVAYFVPAILEEPAGETGAESVAQGEEPLIFLVLNIADAKDGSVRQVTSFLPSPNFLNILPFFDQYQRSTTIWSPDGNYLAVSARSTEDGTPGIFIVPSSGSLSPRFLVEGTLAFWSWE